MTRHVVSIGGVTLGLQADKTVRLVGLIEHQEGTIAGDPQALAPRGVVDVGQPLPTAMRIGINTKSGEHTVLEWCVAMTQKSVICYCIMH